MSHFSVTSDRNGTEGWSRPQDAEIVSLYFCDPREKARAIATAIEQFETLPRPWLTARPAANA